MPGAAVLARNLTTNFERAAASDAEGNYLLSSLPLGPYQIEVRLNGFKTEVRSGITLAAGDRVRVDLALTPGQVSESVTVNAEAPLVNSASPELGVVIDARKVAELPLNGRSFTDLVRLQPGVQASGVGGRNSFVLNGATQWGLNITLDGTDSSFIETPSFGYQSQRTLMTTVSVDSIQEFKVSTGTFTAETGRASGGAVNVVTKSGTNQFHGSLFEYFRNDALDARNFFTRLPQQKDKRRQNQFGGSLGGPVIKDKVFFFANYEGARLRIGQIVQSNTPTQSFRDRSPAAFRPVWDAVPLPTEPILVNGVPNPDTGLHRRSDNFIDDEDLVNFRGDYATARSLSFARFSYNNSDSSQPFLIPKARQNFPARNHLFTFSNTFTFSPTVVNEVRLGYNRWFLPRENGSFAGGFGEVGISGLLPAGYNLEGRLRWASNLYTFADNLSWRAGSHALKGGVEIRQVHSGRIQRQNPVYTYDTAAQFLANRPARVQIQFGQPGAAIRQWQNGVYVQDDWQVNARLTLNLGLRWEYYSPWAGGNGDLYNIEYDPFGTFRPQGAQIYQKDLNNFNPRLGLAWDVTGEQKTVVRAGFGVYSSALPAWGIWGLATIDPRLPFTTAYTQADIPGGLSFPIAGNLLTAFTDPRSALNLGLLPAVVGRRIIDPNLRDTYSVLGNLSIQQQLSQNVAVQIAYVGNHNLKAYSTRLINLRDPALGRRPDPTKGDIEITDNEGRRKYNALQLTLRARQKFGLTTDVHYTWSHSIAYGNDDCCSGGGNRIQDFDNIAGSSGDANTDIRHQLTFSYAYDLPIKNLSHAFLRQALEGWAIQGITQMRTGTPLALFSGRDTRGNGLAATQRVNYLGGSYYPDEQTVDNWFNRAAFADPAAGQFGNLGYNALRGPGSINFDISALKNFKLFETHALQFRAEFFNAFNRANFNNPVNTRSNPNFGRIIAAGSPRIIQFSLRYQF